MSQIYLSHCLYLPSNGSIYLLNNTLCSSTMLVGLGSFELLSVALSLSRGFSREVISRIGSISFSWENLAYNSADYYKLLQFKDNGNFEDLERRSILAITPQKESQVLSIYCGSCIYIKETSTSQKECLQLI